MNGRLTEHETPFFIPLAVLFVVLLAGGLLSMVMYRHIPSDSRFPGVVGCETQTEHNAVLTDLENTINGFTLSGTFVPPCTYIVGLTSGQYYANNAYQTIYGGAANAGGVSGTDFSAVIQACLNALVSTGGVIHQKAFTPTALTQISIPYTNKSIIWEGEGDEATVITAGAAMASVIHRASSGTTWHRVTLSNFGVDCANGLADTGIDMSEANAGNECPKGITLDKMRVEGYEIYGIDMNHCDNSVLTDCIVENPKNMPATPEDYSGSARPLRWTVESGKVKVVRGYYHPGVMEVAGQSITLDTVQLAGVIVVDDSHVLHMIDPEMPACNNATTAFIQVASGKWLGDLLCEGPVIALENGQNFVEGEFARTIRITDLAMYIDNGDTATIFPSSPTLTSKDIAGGIPVRAYLTGGIFNAPAGTINIVPGSFTAGIDIVEVDWAGNTMNVGNSGKVSTPGGGLPTTHAVTLPIPLASGSYMVEIEGSSVNGYSCWPSARTNTGFTLNWNLAGGWAVTWTIKYVGYLP